MNEMQKSQFNCSIEKIETIQQGKDFLSQLTVLKDALIAADRFRQESIKFAKLECDALIKIAELGGINQISGKGSVMRKKAAKWLYSISESERIRYIEMCDDGITIENIFYREIESKNKLEDGIRDYRETKDAAIDKYEKEGIIDFGWYAEVIKMSLEPDIYEPLIDGMRNEIRKKGAVSDGHGFYINPRIEKEKAKDAVQLRIRSIKKDLESIIDICACFDEKPEFEINEFGEYNEIYIALGILGKITLKYKNEIAFNKFIDKFFDAFGTSYFDYQKQRTTNDENAAELIGKIFHGGE